MFFFIGGLAVGSALTAAAMVRFFGGRWRRMGRFFSFAVHEINTPITAVNMTIMNLLGEIFGPVAPGQKQWIELMHEQMARLSGLVGELRDVIHIEYQKGLPIDMETMALGEALDKSLRLTRQGFANAGVKVNVSVPAHIPLVKADADRLPRTLTSLLLYARKFRTAGDVDVSARLLNSRQAEVQVKYIGTKLSPAQAGRCLDLFFPAMANDDHGMAASGLGLGILRAVARGQGGDLQFRVSAQGESCLNLILCSE